MLCLDLKISNGQTQLKQQNTATNTVLILLDYATTERKL